MGTVTCVSPFPGRGDLTQAGSFHLYVPDAIPTPFPVKFGVESKIFLSEVGFNFNMKSTS